jgi:hypothetical protein
MPALRPLAALMAATLATLATLAAGCEADLPPAARSGDLLRPRLGFAINVPAGWTFRDLGGDVVLEMTPRTPAESPAAETVAERPLPVIHVVVIDREGLTLEDWARQEIDEAAQLQADLDVVRKEPVQVSGREGLVLELHNPRAVRPLVQRMLLTVTDRRAYAVLATATEADLPALEAAIETCDRSLVVW